MANLSDILRRAARRDLAQRALVLGGLGLNGALAAACVLLLAERGLGLEVPIAVYVVLGIVGFAAGAVAAVIRPAPPRQIATRLDRAFALGDRLGSAVDLRDSARDSSRGRRAARSRARHDVDFAELVLRDADRAAARVDVAYAVPVRLSRQWGSALLLVVLLVLGVLFLPAFGPRPGAAAKRTAAEIAQQEEVLQQEREEVARSIEEILRDTTEDLGVDDAAADETIQREIDALERLAAQLDRTEADAEDGDGGAGPPRDPDAARDEAAARLSELGDRLAEQADRDARAADELARRFAGMEPSEEDTVPEDAPDPSRGPPPSTADLVDALKRGDYEEAAKQLENLLERSETLTDDERKTLAENLRDLGEQAEAAGSAEDLGAEERRARLEEALRDQGLDEQDVQDLIDGATAEDGERERKSGEDLERALEDRNVDEEIARKIARDIEKLRGDEAVDEQVRRDADDVADALDDAADIVEDPAAAQNDPADRDTDTQPPADSETPQDAPRDGAEPAPQDAPRDGAEETPQESPRDGAEKQPQQTPPEGAEKQPQQTPPEGAEKQPQQTPTEGAEKQPQQTPTEGAEKQPQQTPTEGAEKQPQQTPPDGAEQQPQQGPTDGAEQQPQQTPPDGAEQQPQQTPAEGAEQQPQQTPAEGAEQQPQQTPAEGAEQQPQQTPAEGAEKQPQQEPSEPRPDPRSSSDPGAPPSPAEALRQLQERRERADRSRESAERAREAAKRMAENMTEEERRRWAEQWRREMGPEARDALDGGREPGDGAPETGERTDGAEFRPTTIEDIDLAAEDDTGAPVAEQLVDEGPEGREPLDPAATRAAARERVREAQRAAERAVNESAVPSRYHRFIKRYFKRLEETAEKASAKKATAPAAPDARPASDEPDVSSKPGAAGGDDGKP